MPQGSNRVVYAALVGNLLVAGSKFVAAAFSGSSAMLTEAIHSSADSANQVLLLIGAHRSKARPDRSHNFGYGPEIYFWTFVVAVLVLLAGGGVSLFEGLAQLKAPKPIQSLPISLAVLAASVLFEGGSLLFGLREAERVKRRHVIAGAEVGFWRFIVLSKDPNLYETLLEDSAALVGIAIALAGVIGNAVLGWLWADGAASCAIGVLLIADAFMILRATSSLIAGEAVAPPFQKDLSQAVEGRAPEVSRVETLHLGPDCVVVTLTLAKGAAAAASPGLDELVGAVRAVDDRIEHVLIRA